MFQSLLFAGLLAVQDPKPAKTVEERIKELSDRIAVLDKKATDLAAENHELQRRIAIQEQTKDSVAKATASHWMKRHAGGLGLDPDKSAALERLWIAWTREDFGKAVDEAAWKKREETLRKELTPEQAALVEKSVRAEIDAAVDLSIGSYAIQAQIAAERQGPYRKILRNRLKPVEAGLIPQAHPGAVAWWLDLYTALGSSLPELAGVLTPEEHARLSRLVPPRKEK
jgi:hypothetical protein